jgi:hypothetical protein
VSPELWFVVGSRVNDQHAVTFSLDIKGTLGTARRMKIKPSSLARIEGSLVSREHSPSFSMPRKYAAACGRKLIIKLA